MIGVQSVGCYILHILYWHACFPVLSTDKVIVFSTLIQSEWWVEQPWGQWWRQLVVWVQSVFHRRACGHTSIHHVSNTTAPAAPGSAGVGAVPPNPALTSMGLGTTRAAGWLRPAEANLGMMPGAVREVAGMPRPRRGTLPQLPRGKPPWGHRQRETRLSPLNFTFSGEWLVRWMCHGLVWGSRQHQGQLVVAMLWRQSLHCPYPHPHPHTGHQLATYLLSWSASYQP